MKLLTVLAIILSSWTMSREGSSETWKVETPCTVAGALNAAGYFGDSVLEGTAYREVSKDIFDDTWNFETTFQADPRNCNLLKFEGLNFYADIFVNGTKIAASDTTYGVFCVREYDITSLARKTNTLKVSLRRAQKGDLNAGYVDWNPRPLDESMGIVRPVSLISTPDVEVQDVFVKPLVDASDLSKASVEVRTTLVNRRNAKVNGKLEAVCEGCSFSRNVTLLPGETVEIVEVRKVENPRIWWSRDLGTPEMYDMDVKFVSGHKVSDSKSVRFGLRSIEGVIDENGHRQFILNGKKVLVKSGGWADDIFMQDTPESLRAQVELTCNMGLNSIRFENIWGKTDEIYSLCDEYGLMALVGWSCQWEWEDYCGLPESHGYGCINDPRSEALALRYFEDQVRFLRNHPSVIGWMTGSDRIPNPRLEEGYLKIYRALDYRPYVNSAKSQTSKVSGLSGTKMEGPYEYVGPDYWYIDKHIGGAFGFNTETGIGANIPQIESLYRLAGRKDLGCTDPVLDYHCTASSSAMNSTKVLNEVVAGLYGAPEDFEDFVKKAHAVDYDGTRAMFEAFRCNVPNTTGIVQWMLNSAWPSLYWQMYDWYLVPTAGYYGTQQGCRPVQLVYNYADHKVYAVNETAEAADVEASIKVFDAKCSLLRCEKMSVKVEPRCPKAVFDNIQGPCFVALEINGEHNFYCVPEKNNIYDWKKSNWYISPISEYSDLSFVSALPEARVSMTARRTDAGYEVALTNGSPVIAYLNILKALSSDGNLVPAVLWSENFISLTPGETRTVECTLPEGCGDVEIIIDGWNLKK